MCTSFARYCAVLLAVFAACGNDDPAQPKDTVSIDGVWVLHRIAPDAGDTAVLPEPLGAYTLEFRQDSSLEGTNACNACTGAYAVLGSRLMVADFACTEIACENPATWSGYMEAVQRASTVHIRDGELFVATHVRDVAWTMVFRRQVDSSRANGT